ncbi:MAG TPA: hypothetical protein VFZ96_05080 [Actinomycetota bacterium]|nr:hypothetical protein [Actinomycetota bacterium]
MTHTSPKAPKDRAWNWHGTAEAEKGDEILERGGWNLFALPEVAQRLISSA